MKLRTQTYPTVRAVLLAALGLTITLIMAIIVPSFWVLGAGWVAAILGLVVLDVLLSASVKRMKPDLEAPKSALIGHDYDVRVTAHFGAGVPPVSYTHLTLPTKA